MQIIRFKIKLATKAPKKVIIQPNGNWNLALIRNGYEIHLLHKIFCIKKDPKRVFQFLNLMVLRITDFRLPLSP